MMRDSPPVSSPALRARDTLRRVFGFAAFRGAQEDIVGHVCAGGDALVLMPTGGGKSLCYQIPALLRDGTAVVVSPLIALMQDQVAALTQAGVRAAALNSSLPAPESRADRARVRGGGARSALRRAGAAAHAALPRAHRSRGRRAVRDRRGALRVAVGPRFPARVSRPVRAARALSRGAAHRAHRHRRSAHAGRDRRTAGARRRARVRVELRPAQHPLHDRRQGRCARATARLHPRRASGRGGHRLLPVAPPGRRDGRVAGRQGHRGDPVSRGDGQCGPVRQPGAVPARGRHRRRRDDRLRHGHRQAGRALRRASGPAEERRGLLPGDRPRGARRTAGGCVDGLRTGRRRAAAAAGRAVGGGRRVQARGERQARRAARSRGDRILPPRAAARLLRRGERAVRQLRQLPGAAATRGMRPTPPGARSPRSTAPGSVSARPT